MERWPLVEPLALQTCLAWFILHCDMPSNTIIHHQLEEKDSDPHRERCVCRRDRDCITIFMDSGRVHSVPLPFLVIIYDRYIPLKQLCYPSFGQHTHCPMTCFTTILVHLYIGTTHDTPLIWTAAREKDRGRV